MLSKSNSLDAPARATGPRKILFYGNCQSNATATAIAIMNPDIDVRYAGNSQRVVDYDPDRTARLMEWCDIIISQPVMNVDNADYYEKLAETFGDRLVFMPYVYFDAFFSLYYAPHTLGRTKTGVVGEEAVIEELQRVGFRETVEAFVAGQLDFRHAARLDFNFRETARRESLCQIKLAPFVQDNYRRRQVLLTHNHPMPDLIDECARQIAEILSPQYTKITSENPVHYSRITLGQGWDFIMPFAKSELGLCYPYDLHWHIKGRNMIEKVASALDISTDS